MMTPVLQAPVTPLSLRRRSRVGVGSGGFPIPAQRSATHTGRMEGLVPATALSQLLAFVGIPLLIGLLLCIRPQLAMKSTGCAEKDQARLSLARKCGALLLVVAGVYFVTTSAVG